MAKRVEYVRPLGHNVRKRHPHVHSRGSITRFVVQLELFYNGEWRPVVRYDTAHGYVHVNVCHASGETEKERLLLGLDRHLGPTLYRIHAG